MNWLLHNPLADMSGPEFLVFFVLFVAGIALAVRLQSSAADRSASLPAPQVGGELDPYEVAYLRGGTNEVLRFAVFDLTRRGVLKILPAASKKERPLIAQGGRGGGDSELERRVVAFFAEAKEAGSLFDSDVPKWAAPSCDQLYAPKLLREQYLSTPEMRANRKRTLGYGFLLIALLAAYRLWEALVRGHHNIIILIAMAVIVFAFFLAWIGRSPRLTQRGRTYLQRLRSVYRPQLQLAGAAPSGLIALPIMVAATGMSALAGTEYESMNRMFAKQSSSGSCGGGCGSGSSSGGGDGGADGGGCGSGCGG